ncbi:hypothetical protein CC86DRAFT_386796 [Ophiobolus disseminans]|uniref:Uncharacterized protein n=1 Tax=Ophiobolus disseminans TaxID=1469910 RepID=A0A6A6ZLQ6_9PLEO|nr:hypothetical protein CC86DRAFT_386796 [Ophiobolus disseminans]
MSNPEREGHVTPPSSTSPELHTAMALEDTVLPASYQQSSAFALDRLPSLSSLTDPENKGHTSIFDSSNSSQIPGMAQQNQHNGYTQAAHGDMVSPTLAQHNPVVHATSPSTMTFRQILDIPIVNVPQQTGPPATTATRPPNGFLLREMVPRQNDFSNQQMLHRFISWGAITDPYPHYLFSEVKDLINWVLELFTVKLNAMLDSEALNRPKTKLIRSVKPGKGEGHEELAKWARTGQRKHLQFRMYNDWVTLLETFNLDSYLELSIADLMELITEAHRRVFGNVPSGLVAPQLQTPAPFARPPAVWQQRNENSFPSLDASTSLIAPQSIAHQSFANRSSIGRKKFSVFMDDNESPAFASRGNTDALRDTSNTPKALPLMMTVAEHNSRARSIAAEDNSHLVTSGKRKASPSIGDYDQPFKIARHDMIRFSSTAATEIVNEDLIDPELLDTVASSSTMQNFPSGEIDIRSYIETLRKDFSHRPIGFEEIEMIDTPLPPDSAAAATNEWLIEQIKGVWQQLPPFRCLPTPMSSDHSQFARCVRFAQLHSQEDVKWRVHHTHVAEIEKRANWYGMEMLQGRTEITFESNDPDDRRREFEALLAMRFAKGKPDTAYIAASIGMIYDVMDKQAAPSYVLGMLTDEEKARYPQQVELWEKRHAAFLTHTSK